MAAQEECRLHQIEGFPCMVVFRFRRLGFRVLGLGLGSRVQGLRVLGSRAEGR